MPIAIHRPSKSESVTSISHLLFFLSRSFAMHGFLKSAIVNKSLTAFYENSSIAIAVCLPFLSPLLTMNIELVVSLLNQKDYNKKSKPWREMKIWMWIVSSVLCYVHIHLEIQLISLSKSQVPYYQLISSGPSWIYPWQPNIWVLPCW